MLTPMCSRSLACLFARANVLHNVRMAFRVQMLHTESRSHIRIPVRPSSFCTGFATHAAAEKPAVQEVLDKFSRFKDHQQFRPVNGMLSALKSIDAQDRHESGVDILTTFRRLSAGRDVTATHVQHVWQMVTEHGAPEPDAVLACLRLCASAGVRPPSAVAALAMTGGADAECAAQLTACLWACGDTAAAAAALEALRSAGRPTPDWLVHAVIVGHGRAGDMDAALDTVQALLPPTAQSDDQLAATLMLAYAWARQPARLATLVTRRRAQQRPLPADECVRVVVALLETGQQEAVHQVMALFPWDTFNFKTLACVRLQRHLVRLCLPRLAVSLLEMAQRSGVPGADVRGVARVLLMEMVVTGQDVDSLSEVCAALTLHAWLPRGWLDAAERLYRLDQCRTALTLLGRAHAAGQSLRDHMFWPALLPLARAGDVDGVLDAVSQMLEADVQPSKLTLRQYVLPAYQSLPQRPLAPLILQQLKQRGLTVAAVVDALVEFLIASRMDDEAVRTCEQYCSSTTSSELVGIVLRGLLAAADVAACVGVLRCAFQQRADTEDPVGAVLMSLCRARAANPDGPAGAALTELVKALLVSELRVSPLVVDLVLEQCSELSPATLRALPQLADGSVSSRPWESDIGGPMQPVSVEELEDHLIELKKKGGNIRGILRKLILTHCRKNHLERVQSLEKEMNRLSGPDEKEPMTAGVLSSLLSVHVNHGLLEAALGYKRRLDALAHEHHKLDTFKLIQLATLLLRERRNSEAFSTLSEVSTISTQAWRDCNRLVNEAVLLGDPQLTRDLLHVLREKGVDVSTKHHLGQVIASYINKGDLTEALDEYVHCCTTHGVTPYTEGLMYPVLKISDSETRQPLMDAIYQQLSRIYGAEHADYEVGLAYAFANYPELARPFFKRLLPYHLKRGCIRLQERGKVAQLLSLLAVVPPGHLHIVYRALLRRYRYVSSEEGAADILSRLRQNTDGSQLRPLRNEAERLLAELSARRPDLGRSTDDYPADR